MEYKCKLCESLYRAKTDAINCCYKSERAWKCSICQDIFDQSWQANECCEEEKFEEIEESKS